MARQVINLGNTPSGQGPGADTSRSAFDKCNKNFEELYESSTEIAETLNTTSEKVTILEEEVTILEEEVPLEEAQEGISSKVKGWTARRVFDAIKSWVDRNLGTAAKRDVGFRAGQVFYVTQTGFPTVEWMNGWFITQGEPISGIPEWRTVISLPYGVEGGKYTGTFISQNLGSGETMLHCVRQNNVLPSRTVMDSLNTTVASSGAIHSASPIIKLFNNKHEIENESEFGLTPSVVKLSTGAYEITNTLGLRADSWFLDTPQDRNGNKYFNVDYEEVIGTEVDGVLDLGVKEPEEVEEFIGTLEPTKTIIRCFERVWNPQTGLFENGEPVDIKEGRFITLRFNEVTYSPKFEESENVG